MKLLLVEDDNRIAREVKRALERENFNVHWVATGRQALKQIAVEVADIMVLDLGLPDMDGLEVLQQLKRLLPDMPVLILTARDSVHSKVDALDSGADDYIVKPFEMAELLARLRVLARRLSTATSSDIRVGEVNLDLSAHSLQVNGELVACSRREYMILQALMENAGRIQTKDALERKLYGWGENIASNTVEVHISNLRKKLPTGFIQTIRGVGYTVSK